jgi:hypothetical protein
MSDKPESNLPPIPDPQYVEIRSLAINQYEIPTKQLNVEWTYVDEDQWHNLVPGHMYKIEHPVWGSYIPSKVICSRGELYLIYYVNPDLPIGVRPFTEGYCYAWVTEWSPTLDYRYPAESRVFIDQVVDVSSGKVFTVFITSATEFEKLTFSLTAERKIALEGDLAIYMEGN